VKLLFKIFTLILALLSPCLYGEPAAQPSPTPTPFDVPIPVGIPVNGIKVPHYDESGRLAILIEADVAQKSDESTVRMENLRLEALDEEDRKIHIELPVAVLNLETRILNGDSSATIRREDFTITGDSIEFDTKNRFGTMRGSIRMVVNTANTEP
jgi:hypothetical protein